MKQVIKRLTNLMTVKSIVTIMLSVVFCYLSIKGKVSTENFMAIFTMVIGFYFGTQAKKGDEVWRE